MFGDLLTALMLLTRLPVGGLSQPQGERRLARAVWAFPVVGLLVGAIGGLAYWCGYRLGMPPLLSAAWAFGVTLASTGAFHEDGLADVADGFGGGRSIDRKLEIMRDSRIGSYGALALAWSALIRVAAVASMDRPALVFAALVAAGVIGRAGIIVPLLMLKPARLDGIAASLGRPPKSGAVLAFAIAFFVVVTIVPMKPAVIVMIVGGFAGLAMSFLARRQIGGHTGDVLGATEVTVECVVLSVLSIVLR